jgi:hypothetical protein
MQAKEVPMITADIDPSLCGADTAPESLDDGFSPPAPQAQDTAGQFSAEESTEPGLGTKSPF